MPNLLFPGKPRYKGPNNGYFFACHHDTFCEFVSDAASRVAHIKYHKPPHERKTRLEHFMYIGDIPAFVKYKELEKEQEVLREAIFIACGLTIEKKRLLQAQSRDLVCYIWRHTTLPALEAEIKLNIKPFKWKRWQNTTGARFDQGDLRFPVK